MFRFSGFVIVLALAMSLTACGSDPEPELGTGAAFVEDVVVEERNGEYWAIVTGFYPEACSTYGGSAQEVAGNTIELTVTSTRPEEEVCAQALTPMTEEILLDTAGLDTGEYTVIANENRSTNFVIS